MPRPTRGQALVEFALVVPILALLAFGGLYVTLLISCDLKAGYAARAGARVAAELGGRQSNPTATTAQIDAAIVSDVLAGVQGTAYMTVDEIDVYAATSSDGTIKPTDLADVFDGSGHPLTLQSFALDSRLQTPPAETSIGVRVKWHFSTPFVGFGTVNTSSYAVMRCAPVAS